MCDNNANYFQRLATNSRNNRVREIFTILSSGEAELCNKSQPIPNQAILVLGNAKSGRSTFTKWMTGQDTKIVARSDPSCLHEFFVFDPDQKPGFSPLPVLFTDSEGNNFYDFPTFAVHLDISYAIVTHYFARRILANVSKVKICFLIEHFRMALATADQDDLRNYLRHVIEMIINIDKFKNSFLLVATKISRDHSATPNDRLITGLAVYLRHVRQVLEKQIGLDEEEKSKVIAIINLLLEEQNRYPRLAFSRSPHQEGSLSNISLLQNNKNLVRTKLLQGRSFANATGDDYGSIVSKISFRGVADLLNEIRADVIRNVRSIGNQVQRYFTRAEAAITLASFDTDMVDLYDRIKYGYQVMLAMKTSAAASATPKQCVNLVFEGANNATSNSLTFDLSSTVDNAEAFEFLVINSRNQLTTPGWCVEGLDDINQNLDELRRWYGFANKLYNRLILHVSENMGSYYIADNDLNKQVSATDLGAFLRRNYRDPLFSEYDFVKELKLDRHKLENARQIAAMASEFQLTNQTGYGTRRNLRKLYDLEYEVYITNSKDCAALLPMYEKLYAEVDEYVEKRANDQATSYFRDNTTLSYLRISTLSRLRTIDSNVDNYLIVDDLYFQTNEGNIFNYRDSLDSVQTTVYRQQYQATINHQVIKTYVLLESTAVALDRIYDAIDREITQSINNTDGNTLSSQVMLKTLVGMLRVNCLASNFWGPMGVVASAARDLILSYLDGYLETSDDTSKPMINGSIQFANTVKEIYSIERVSLRDHLLKLEINKIKDVPDLKGQIENDATFNTIVNRINNLTILLENSTLNEIDYWQQKRSVKEDLNKYYDTLTQEMNERKKALLREWTSRIKKTITFAESGVKDFATSTSLASKIGEDSMKKTDDVVSKLKEFEYSVRAQLISNINMIQANVTDVLRNWASRPYLVFTQNKLAMTNLRQEFQKNIDSFVKQIQLPGSQILQNVQVNIDKLLDGMRSSVLIYNRIQDYEYQTRMAAYFKSLKATNYTAEKSNLREDLAQLELQIKTNLILQEVQKALSTFKQYVFPFASSFVVRFDIAPYFQGIPIEDLVLIAVDQINQLREDLFVNIVPVGNNLTDNIIDDVLFTVGQIREKAFYIWRHDTYGKQISQLLQGSEITLNADITRIREMNDVTLNAVKLNEIGIQFSLQNKSMEAQLRELMVNFKVRMTHMGDSHYRCNDDYYNFDHSIVIMTHSAMNTGSNGSYYFNHSSISDRIDKNIPIFSPYASWKIVLLSRPENHDITTRDNFRTLENFLQQPIDLALEGRGSYVKSPTKSCSDNLKEYYKYGGKLPAPQPPPQKYYYHDPNAHFATNSVIRIKAPLNQAINWLTGTLGYSALFWIRNEKHFDIINDRFRSIFASLKLLDVCSAEDCTGAAPSNANFNLNESLTLVDFFIRWFTKAKTYNNNVGESVNSTQITAFVLNLVERVEYLVEFDLIDKPRQFDALTLISKLEKKLINNRNVTEVIDILYQAVVDANPNLNSSLFRDHVRQKIAKIVSAVLRYENM